jgi:SAM-dependent methyltransferase
VACLLRLLPPWLLEEAAARAVSRRARRLPPDEALRFLFRIDHRLYGEQGRQAVRYGGGVHTKHRHTRYHDFFVDQIHPRERVLDIGCGIGALAYDVARRSEAEVVGVDCSQQNLQQARERFRHPRLTYYRGNVLQAIPEGRFDVVVLSNVLEHLPDRSDLLRRLAQSTGARRFLIRVPAFERDWRVPLRRELELEWRLDDDHLTEYTQEEFREEMQSAGLVIERLEARWGEFWAVVVPNTAAQGRCDAA